MNDPNGHFVNNIIEGAFKKGLPTYNIYFCGVFSIKSSPTIELSTNLATPKLRKIMTFKRNAVYLAI